MKPGSLVVCIRPVETGGDPAVKWLPVGDNETPYIVRQIETYSDGATGVMLEEGVVGYDTGGNEIGINIKLFREIQPPEEVSISALMEEVNEMELFAV